MAWVTVAGSDIGGREEQQDFYLKVRSSDHNYNLLAVADGAGGHKMGALAAQTVIQCIRENLPALERSEDPTSFIGQLIVECNQRVLKVGDSEMACSTLVLVFIKGEELFWGHIGDSRLYLIRDNKVIFQTTDHSTEELQKNGNDECMENDFSTVSSGLYMCLGALPNIIYDVESGLAREGDILLLCSDGLWGQMDMDRMIAELSTSSLNPENVTTWLTQARQLKQERSDNITLLAAKYGGEPSSFSRLLTALTKPFRNLMKGAKVT